MTYHFRLIQAVGEFESMNIFSQNQHSPPIKVDFYQDLIDNISDEPWVSVIIGKNGVGKSRLLSGIASAFDVLDSGRKNRRSNDTPLSKLIYSCDGNICEVEIQNKYPIGAKLNGESCAPNQLPLPTKIIALTTTPFDKFRIPNYLYSSNQPEDSSRYSYLGLRDRTGRASTVAVIFRALEGLFEASRSEKKRKDRIAEIFDFLGYRPYVEVNYDVKSFSRERLVTMAEGDFSIEAIEKSQSSSYQRGIETMLDRDPLIAERLQRIALEVLNRSSNKNKISIRADFYDISLYEDALFQDLQLLRKLNLIQMGSVMIEKEDGTILDLKNASSGELGIVTTFLGLASIIEDGSLIFIDEPEISLHPEWQTKYIELLIQTFGSFRGCHFILATHSPLILSDVSTFNSNVITLSPQDSKITTSDEFSGQSSDSLLVNAFQVPGKNNLYLKQEIIKALRLAADGKKDSEEYKLLVEEMMVLLPHLEPDSPIAQVIRNLDNITQE